MNAEEAKNTIKHSEKYCDIPDIKSHHQSYSIAVGYLKALEGPEVKALIEALEETYENEMCWDTNDEEECGECGWCKAKSAIKQYHKAIKK